MWHEKDERTIFREFIGEYSLVAHNYARWSQLMGVKFLSDPTAILRNSAQGWLRATTSW